MIPPGGPPGRRASRTPGWARWGVPALLAVHAALLARGAAVHSPTYNEPAHLVAGIGYWRFGRTDLYCVNPPLVRMVAAIPVLLAGCETDWGGFRGGPGVRPEMALGADFCRANGPRTIRLMTLARWACIPFSLLGGWACARWGRELHGPAAGLLSAGLWCFCPNVLAHGQLITSDVAAAALGVSAWYAFWRWLGSPTWRLAVAGGLALGLAELTKTTLVVLYPLGPILWLVDRWPGRRGMSPRDWLRESGMLGTSLALSLYVINLCYGFEGSMTRLGDYRFASRSLGGPGDPGGNRFAGTRLGRVPVPLPRDYLAGIDLQRKDFESFGHEFYLGGAWSPTGWWYYYLYALAIKVPLGTWLLLPVAMAVRLRDGPPSGRRDDLVLLAPPLVILTLVSSQTGVNEHLRYVLPIFPFAFIWLGGAAGGPRTPGGPPRSPASNALVGLAVAASVAWSTASSLRSYPHSLSYFNEIVGGPENGWRHLTGSNVDWGQDLLFLKRWADDHPGARPLRLALYGAIDPGLVGIDGRVFSWDAGESGLEPGYYAVSATVLAGFGRPRHPPASGEIGRLRLCGTAGGSIFVLVKD